MFRIHSLPADEAASDDFSAAIGGERAAPWLCRVSAMSYNTNREIALENVSFNGRRLLPEQIRLEKGPFDEVALK